MLFYLACCSDPKGPWSHACLYFVIMQTAFSDWVSFQSFMLLICLGWGEADENTISEWWTWSMQRTLSADVCSQAWSSWDESEHLQTSSIWFSVGKTIDCYFWASGRGPLLPVYPQCVNMTQWVHPHVDWELISCAVITPCMLNQGKQPHSLVTWIVSVWLEEFAAVAWWSVLLQRFYCEVKCWTHGSASGKIRVLHYTISLKAVSRCWQHFPETLFIKPYRWWTPEIPWWNMSTSFSRCTVGVEEWFREGIQLSFLRLKNINPHSFSCEQKMPHLNLNTNVKTPASGDDNISCFQGANLLPMAAYKTWWIGGLWGQGDTMCPVCINGEEVNPWGWCRGNLFRHVGFKSRFKASLSTSWHFSSCYLFSISGIKSQQKAQDVECSQPFGPLQLLSWVLAGETCRCTSSLCILYPLCLSSLPLSHGVHLLRNSSPGDSRPIPTVSCCHFATSDHLEIHPTIKSFSRNPALQTWNARQSLSGWAVQSQSWTVYRLPPQRHLSSSWHRWWVKLKLQNRQNQQ